ncbi:MAG: ABC transporter ATP-binding protein [Acidobacteria bacterium]|jgi:ABC-type multidrug transport system ATPase subunit|nr:ABC transporter ATP-binding protein [Acidobacteriota bacterium]
MVRLEHVSKSFAAVRAVDDVSLDIKKAAITILTGADGAGKSTLFRMLVGLVKKDRGAILLNGEEIGDDYSRITSICGYMPERFSLYTDLSVEENMDFFAAIQQVPPARRRELKQRLLARTGMEPFRRRRAGDLSGGMKQKLALSTILLSSPELIILDEPTTGVDPLSRIEFFAIIEALKNEGKTIVMSTPYLAEAEKGDYVVFVKNGRVMLQDALASLRDSFPARLFRILPRGNVFEAMRAAAAIPGLESSAYMRGKFIQYLQTGSENLGRLIPHLEMIEEKPGLEDMYIYYERRQ